MSAARNAQVGEGRHNKDTLWRLVQAQCDQLASAVSAARVPFLLSLLWAFIWAWQLYSFGYGYINDYRERYERWQVETRLLQNSIERGDAGDTDKLLSGIVAHCRWVSPGLIDPALSTAAQIRSEAFKLCTEVIGNRQRWAESNYLDYSQVSLPGGFSKIHISDLSVVGQFGLILVLMWSFFAIRRENHAIASFVDRDFNSRRAGRLFPARYVLEPQMPYLSAEHYAFAYHSVAERFLFVLSGRRGALFGLTIALVAFPAMVSAFNFYTDVRDIHAFFVDASTSLYVRTGIELLLVSIILTAIVAEAYYVLDTSTLLNGWYLAVRDVWTAEWDERDFHPASNVLIDVHSQHASVVRGPDPA